jgi:SAM-dependent methyltransferase
MRISRKCPVCSITDHKLVFGNRMTLLDSYDLSYDVVFCRSCKFAFATDILDEASIQKYYSEYSKYDIAKSVESIATHTRQSAANCARFIRQRLSTSARVLDIGSSIGVLLNELKQLGFRDLRGLDPGPGCREIAKILFDIDVECGFLSDKTDLHDYDLIILANVLEHIPDPAGFLGLISSRVKRGAYLFIEVPAGDMFYRNSTEYMGEFSIEHINYFGKRSLANLLQRQGYHELETSYASCGNSIITLECLCRFNGDANLDISPDTPLEESISSYVASHLPTIQKINRILKQLPDRIIVYGAGSHTARLLAQSDLRFKQIEMIVDKNPNLIGKKLGNALIRDVKQLRADPHSPILISSFHYQDEIKKQLMESGLKNNLVSIY